MPISASCWNSSRAKRAPSGFRFATPPTTCRGLKRINTALWLQISTNWRRTRRTRRPLARWWAPVSPTHPELLDWLASDFIRSGWSLKHLHRVITLSAAYQQASSTPRSEDPENKLLSHFSRRRLDFEAMRDSLLFISGQLDMTMGGRPVDLAGEPLNQRRTLYGLVLRQEFA